MARKKVVIDTRHSAYLQRMKDALGSKGVEIVEKEDGSFTININGVKEFSGNAKTSPGELRVTMNAIRQKVFASPSEIVE